MRPEPASRATRTLDVPTATVLERLPFRRSQSDRVIAGVAAGLAQWARVDPVWARLGFVTLAFAGGAGAVLYGIAWLIVPEGHAARAPAAPVGTARQITAAGLVGAGSMLVARSLGIWIDDRLAASVALVAFGSGLIWTRTAEPRIATWVQAATGGAMVVLGLATLIATFEGAQREFATFALAMLVTLGAGALVLGPWTWRLVGQISDERRERIRSEERAEVAAHLHDSVLQTLALIQRTNDPAEMASLARTQERDLRAWLYRRGVPRTLGPGSLSAALDRMASEVDRRHRIPVHVVTVGDCPLDERVEALVDAAAEAATNAAHHSGAASVSIYDETEPDVVRIYVRDDGRGFDTSAIPPDRRGIADSIRGRVERHGGMVTVNSEEGEGTEIRLELARTGA